MTARHTTISTPVGDLLLVANGAALTGLYFEGHRYPPAAASLGAAVVAGVDPVFRQAHTELDEYFAGRRTVFELELAPVGNDLQNRVWALLQKIPFGETTTYGRLAVQLGNRSLAQAVGQAVGHNPVSIIIACHRVVGADGKLTGYAGGIERKQFLLELEEPALAKASKLF